MPRITLLILLFPIVVSAQVSCDITVSNDTIVCGPQMIPLNVKGEIFDLSWRDSDELSSTSIANPIASVNETQTFYVTNKKLTDNVIVNGDFSEGSTGFTNDYVIDCPNNKFLGDIGTWKEGAPKTYY